MFGDQLAIIREMVGKVTYAKTLEWEHESEYRLAVPVLEDEDWNTMRYHPEEITELYLGLGMSKENKDKIVGMAKEVNLDIAIFQTFRDAHETLTFQKL